MEDEELHSAQLTQRQSRAGDLGAVCDSGEVWLPRDSLCSLL